MARFAWVLLLIGCGADRNGPKLDRNKADPNGVTFYGDVAPLLVDKCGNCHREGGSGPFDAADYTSSVPWAEAMVDAVETGRMPPFYAVSDSECTPPHGFRDDPSLTEDEKQLVADWVDQGKIEGDPYIEGTHEPLIDEVVDPTVVVSLQEPFDIDGDRDLYQCFRVEVPHDSDVWIEEVQILPDNNRVVHHVLVWNDPDDSSAELVDENGTYPCSGTPDIWPTDLIAGWTAGGSPMRAPAGTGELFKEGATIVVNIHYHPTGDSSEEDQTSVAIKYTEIEPANYMTWLLADIPFGAKVLAGPDDTDDIPEFRIPAGAADHVETLSFDIEDYPLPFDGLVFAVTPHMHYLGTDMQVFVRAEEPDEDEYCIIHTPNYKFDFQTSYVYDSPGIELPIFGQGQSIEVRCTYDNSMSNPFIEEQMDAAGIAEPADVLWGEDTSQEMCMAMVGVIIPPIDLSEWL